MAGQSNIRKEQGDMAETLTEKERTIIPDLINLMLQMPVDKLYYLMGYMQSQADQNLLPKNEK